MDRCKNRLISIQKFSWLCFLSFTSVWLPGFCQTDELINRLDSILLAPADSTQIEGLFDCFSHAYQFVQSKEKSQKLYPYAKKMLKLAMESGRPYRIAKANQAMAYITSRIKDYPSSFTYSNLAYTEWEKEKYYKGLAELKFHNAFLQMNNGDETNIISKCREALDICRSHSLIQTEVEIKSWMGGYYMRINQIDSALFFYRFGLEHSGISPHRKVFNTFDVGNCYMLKGDYKMAETYYKKSLQICLKHKMENILSIIYSSLANVKFKEGKLDEAEKLMLECLPFVPKMERLDFRMNHYATLMDINEAQKDYPNALRWAKLFQIYTDSVNNENNQDEYRELEEKYQARLKDKMILEKEKELEKELIRRQTLIFSIVALVLIAGLSAILFVVNRKRKESRMKQKISESEMKALRAQMNPHFMFNSLNSIQQMVFANENAAAYEYLDTYSKLTRQILENSEKMWIPIREEIRFLQLYLKMESLRFDHSFQYQIKVGEEIMPNTDKIPAMLIQPLVENALKHGLLPKEGSKNLKILFDRKDEDNTLVVTVEDNGVGRQKKSGQNSKSEHHSMSLKITMNRLHLINPGSESTLMVFDLTDDAGAPIGTRVQFQINPPKNA